MARDGEQPANRRTSLRIELLAALEGPRKRLGDEIEHDIRLRPNPPTQVAADRRVAALVKEPKVLSATAEQQLLVTRLARRHDLYTIGTTSL